VTGLLLILAGLLLTGLIAWVQVWMRRLREHGHLVVTWRLLTGMTWHGGAVSDRGWFRAGTKTLTDSGHVSRAQHQERWRVTLRRLGGFLYIICAAYGMVVDRPATELALILSAVAAAGYAGFAFWRRLRIRNHRRSWLAPLHATIHRLVNRPITDRPESYITVALDRSRGEIALPLNVSPMEKYKRQLEGDVRARLGIPSAEFDWTGVAGPKPVVTWAPAPKLPEVVTLEMVRDAIETARAGQLIAGLGARDAVARIRLAGDSPHFLVNGPSGSGKSVAVQNAIAQFLFHGGFAIILDFKELSHVWADSLDGTLPNIVYCRSDEDIYDMLMWLQTELRRRNKVARFTARRDGSIEANVGDRLLVAAEELNVTAARLKSWWQDNGDGGLCPAIKAMNEVLFMGRQAKMHMLQASQRADANAVGGGAARENLTARLLLGKIQKPTWKMLAGEFEYPASMSTQLGAGFLVGSDVTAVQTVYLTPQEAWDLSLAGEVADPPHDIPKVMQQRAPQLSPAGEGPDSPVAASPEPPLLGLREAIEAGKFGDRTLPAVRTWRNRYRDRWAPVAGWRGPEELYREADIEAVRVLMDSQQSGRR
jgi:hypothetical protein